MVGLNWEIILTAEFSQSTVVVLLTVPLIECFQQY